MSAPRRQARPYSPPPHRLLSAATFSYIASWRGQLLICTVVLGLGLVYFIIRDPIEKWRHARKDKRSRARMAELVKMEQKEEVKADVEDELAKEREREKEKNARERGREKRKDLKKRKGSILRVGGGSETTSVTGQSSMESSPARLTPSPMPRRRMSASPSTPQINLPDIQVHPTASPSKQNQASNAFNPSSSISSTPKQPIIGLASSSSSNPTSSRQKSVLNGDIHVSPSSAEIPLPASPVAGPSRMLRTTSNPDECIEPEQETVHEMAPIPANGSPTKENPLIDGWSTMPSDGYLPTPTASKKKKRKSKGAEDILSPILAPPLPKPRLEQRNSLPSQPDTNTPATPPTPPILSPRFSQLQQQQPRTPRTPHRHHRTASIGLPQTDQLEDLLASHERTIDSLRAEIGVAKAEEGKAKEDAKRTKIIEERLRNDLDKARRMKEKAEGEIRRREAEYHTNMLQIQQAHIATLHRLAHFESILRDNGLNPSLVSTPLPPPSPGLNMPMPRYATSPIPPSSPYRAQFSPSGYPSAGPPMYSPMYLSQQQHQMSFQPQHNPQQLLPLPLPHSPSPMRRPSSMNLNGGGSLNGSSLDLHSLTSGLFGSSSSDNGMPISPNQPLFDFDPSNSIMPAPRPRMPSDKISENRRLSVESSVLKRKPTKEVENEGDGVVFEVDEEMEVMEEGSSKKSETEETPEHSSSSSSSPKRSQLITPFERDRPLSNGTHHHQNGIQETLESVNLNEDDEGMEGCPRIEYSGDIPTPKTNGDLSEERDSRDSEADRGSENNPDLDYQPFFASLAHTPEQIEEMRRRTDDFARRKLSGIC